jgi:PPOX class probable F420-dependent enzyme
VATVAADGRPRVRPIWYLWGDGSFWLTTRLRSRAWGRDVEARPIVSLSIASEQRPYRAVIATGPVEVVGRDERLLRAISFRYGEPAGRTWLTHAMKEPDRVALRMTPEEILSWDYGRGDYLGMNEGGSVRTPGSERG